VSAPWGIELDEHHGELGSGIIKSGLLQNEDIIFLLEAPALAGVGLGIGTIFGNLLVACARQPNLTRMLFNYAILGFALTEAIGLFALMLAFLMLFS